MIAPMRQKWDIEHPLVARRLLQVNRLFEMRLSRLSTEIYKDKGSAPANSLFSTSCIQQCRQRSTHVAYQSVNISQIELRIPTSIAMDDKKLAMH